MIPLLILAIAFALIVGTMLFLRSRVAKEWDIQVSEIPRLVSKLRASGHPDAWAQLITAAIPGRKDSDIALDYALNDGELAFDWCLLTQKNIEDKQLIRAFLDQNGFTYVEMVADNGCRLLRVTGAGVETVANQILAEIYSVSGPLTLIGDGFEWP